VGFVVGRIFLGDSVYIVHPGNQPAILLMVQKLG